MRPLGGVERPQAPREALDDYLARLKIVLSNSEAIVPEQIGYIPSQYVMPQLCIWHSPYSEMDIHELQDSMRILIVGEPGAGKTTLLRHIGLSTMAYEEDSSFELPTMGRVPIYISLRNWTKLRDVNSALKNTISSVGGDWISSNLRELATVGCLVFMFDGLDELSYSVRQKVVDWLIHFGQSYPKAQIIVTTRPYVKGVMINGFKAITIKHFDTNRVRDFAYKRLYGEKSWKQFVSCYRECHDLQSVLGNPLMLSIAIYLYKRSNLIPQNSAQLLKDFVMALTDTWDSSRGIKRHYDRDFTPERVRNTLGRLAFQCKVKGRNTFTAEEATSWVEQDLKGSEATSYFERLREITGLLCIEQNDKWSFSHRVFMDYFAANYAIDRAEGVKDLFSKHSNDSTWRKTWERAAGLTSDPDYLFRLYTETEGIATTAIGQRAAAVMLESVVMGAKTLNHGTRSLVSALNSSFNKLNVITETTIDRDVDGRETGTGEMRLTFGKGAPSKREIAQLSKLIRTIKMIRWTAYSEEVESSLRRCKNHEVASLALLLQVKGTIVVRTNESFVRISWEPESPEMPYE
jgi:hypothetical protein